MPFTMDSDASPFKICLLNNDSSIKEIRKFRIEAYDTENFQYLCGRLQQMCPELRSNPFTVSWRDKSHDTILILTDEELQLACLEMPEPKSLYIKLNSKEQKPLCPEEQEPSSSKTEEVRHVGVVCDGCNNSISGFRYKCIQCDDYDLCSQCESKGIHPQHCTVRIPHLLHWHQWKSVRHHLKKILKKNSEHPCKKSASNDHTSRRSHCVTSLLETFPDFNRILDMILTEKDYYSNPPNAPSGPHKQPENVNTSQANEAKNETESTKDVDMDSGASKKFPGEGKKLIDAAKNDEGSVSDAGKDDKGSVSDAAKNDKGSVSDASDISDVSNASQNSSKKKVATDEWTIVDKDEITEVNPAPSAIKRNAENQTLYPRLPEQRNVIHHPNPVINRAVRTMIEMGFSNNDKLLTYLLASENGDINRVIEILQPANK